VVVVVLRDPGAIKVQKANRFDPWVNIYTSIRLWCTIVLWYTRCTDERNEWMKCVSASPCNNSWEIGKIVPVLRGVGKGEGDPLLNVSH